MLLASCSSEIEDNTPAMQARVNDSLFFKATDVRALFTDDGDLLIRGITDLETLTLLMRETTGAQGFGECCTNVAAFENSDGRVFSTSPNGSGLTRLSINNNTVSGTFNLTTFSGVLGTRVFSEGVLYEVPIAGPVVDDPNDPDAVEDSFSARVNTVIFNPTVTAAAVSGGNLSLVGESSNASIRLVFPSNTGAGMYEFASTGAFVGVYRVMDTDYPSQSGTLNIISNDTENSVIMGEFSFETGDFSVTEGRFTLNY
ncbi:hypothetical protein EAX61_09350 [Dokdonia sinensis]|uniref:Uncharacterized protein n=2 Tax=Dokdonia sinensis TaxID=2479847 RepID=A0A3M0G7X6_9FLAO|nr:hypothetical protein EAX61_09350 [Dokdonia sinensis]